MSEKVHKKFRKLTQKLWDMRFIETINKMSFKKRLNLAWRILRKDI